MTGIDFNHIVHKMLYRMELADGADTLSPEIGERAAMLAIRSIAQAPQSWGSDTLIADNVLRSYDDPEKYPITLMDMAQLDVDGKDLSGTVNALHEKFGVPYRIEPDIAARYARYAGWHAADFINQVTYDVRSNQGDAPAPTPPKTLITTHGYFDPYFAFNLDAVRDLDQYLQNNPTARRAVSATVGGLALETRRNMRKQQNFALIDAGLSPFHKL